MNAKELRELFEAYFENTLGGAEASKLEAMLREDEAVLARFLEDLELCHLLRHVSVDLDDGEEFVRSFWERVRAEETGGQFASDFEARREEETEVWGVEDHDDLLRALEEDKHRAGRQATERAREDAEARERTIRRAAEEALERFKIEERQRQEELAYKLYVSRQRKLILGITSLSALLVIVVCAWLFEPNAPAPRPPELPQVAAPPVAMAPPVVATLTHSSRVRWDRADTAPVAGLPLVSGPLGLEEGFLEITFKDEARIIVEAPAAVDLIDERSARLDSGVLTAHVPEAARGFVVETPSVRVTDLGTEFALSVDQGGTADVHVLDGWVATSFAAPEHDEQQRVKALHRDDAMRFDARGGTMHSIAVDEERFARSWDEVLYKPDVGGDIKFERSNPPSLGANSFESDDHIHILLERNDVALVAGSTVDITKPGQYRSFEGRSEQIRATRTVDSYLLHWDPMSTRGTERIVVGHVTFRRPIVGLIVTTDRLTSSDRLFGCPGTTCPENRLNIGRRLESEADAHNGDTVVLHPDRLTLEVRLRAISLDQVRVLVTAATAEER